MIRPNFAVLLCFAYLTLVLPITGQSRSGCSNEEAYENRNQIDYGPLKVSAVGGIATDPSKVPVPNACVLLFTERSHHLVSKTATDGDGLFNLARIKNGRYRLVVKAPGFCSANVPIVVGARAGRKRLALHMKMGEIDSCSYGDLK